MGTNTANPERLEALATTLDAAADGIESWGQAAANTMYAFGYAYGGVSTAGSTYGTASWARRWTTSLRSRASMLEAYDRISLVGAAGAGGAGAALGAGRQWALGEPDAMAFQEWYAVRLATLEARRTGTALAARMEAALDAGDYATTWAVVHELVELDAAESAAAFFNTLGVGEVAQLPNQLIGMTSYSNVYVRGSVGHPADLISRLSRQLAAASHTGDLRFAGADLVRADYQSDLLANEYFTGYRAEYLLIAGGFAPAFLADAVAAFLPYSGSPVMAQQVLVSDLDGQFPTDPREFLLPHVAAASAGAEVVLQLIDAGRLDTLLDPWLSYEEAGFTAIAPILEQATLELHAIDPAAAQYVIASLIAFIAGEDRPRHLDVVASAMLLVIPQLGGVMNGSSGGAWMGAAGDREVLVTEDELAAAFGAFATDDAATVELYEGILQHYAGMLRKTDGDPATLNRIAISLAGLSSLLTTAIADAEIADAAARDERIAATIGLITTLAGLVPLPGSQAVGSKVGANLVKSAYSELVDRGLGRLHTDHEGAARSDADAFTDALLFSYTELLTLGHLSTGGAPAVAASIDEFFAAAPHLDRDLYDFSDGAGVLLADLTDRQTQAYGEWISFASGSPEINNAISRMLAEFLQGLPHYAG